MSTYSESDRSKTVHEPVARGGTPPAAARRAGVHLTSPGQHRHIDTVAPAGAATGRRAVRPKLPPASGPEDRRED